MKEKLIPPLDELAAKIAGIGVPALISVMSIGATGYFGAAAVTTALAALGSGGIVGGVVPLLASGMIVSAITKYGIDSVFKAVVKELLKKSGTKQDIINKIQKYPISKIQKIKMKEMVENYHSLSEND
ncbi:hypothetical protein [Leuconostoc gasicomitatum]|uniref:hypothetical protein n=1 Tax=Leuconostoc gasicomitatum TaxID=115778 RepID=UPI0007E29741|nr:hypothetical protein [Leuconostoc gasicomitatum]CUW17806.1 hypothetical protein PB1E_1966 [Leuconostoc gasicomitatum]